MSKTGEKKGSRTARAARADFTPLPSVRRLCMYKRFLQRLSMLGRHTTSSAEIGEHTGTPAYQVRKDINHLGEVGVVGRGYDIAELLTRIALHLDLHTTKPCVVAGMGSLGTALTRYFSASVGEYHVVAGFDVSRSKVGTAVGTVPILPVEQIAEVVAEKKVQIGVLTVPASEAKSTAGKLVAAGVRGILNFTPAIFSVAPPAVRRDIDFTFEIETLSYILSQNGRCTPAKETSSSPPRAHAEATEKET